MNHEALFCQVAASHRGYLTSLAARYVGWTDAEDVVQAALLNAWRRLSSFTGGEHDCLNWLSRVTCNAAIGWQRHASLTDCRPLLDTDHWLDGDDTPEEAALRAEAQREAEGQVEKLLSRCTAKQRHALWWGYGKGWSQQQMAQRWGVPVATVKLWRYRGRLRCLTLAAQSAILPATA